MKNNKKIASLLLSGVMVAGMIPTNVLAANEEGTEGSPVEIQKSVEPVVSIEGNESAKAGGTVNLEAILNLENSESVTYNWELTGNKSVDTKFSGNDPKKVTLTLGDNEIAKNLTVTVTVTVTETESKTATATKIITVEQETTPEPVKTRTLKLNNTRSIKEVNDSSSTSNREIKVGETVKLEAYQYYRDNDDNGKFKEWEYTGSKPKVVSGSFSSRTVEFEMPNRDITLEPMYRGENDNSSKDKDDYKRVYPTNLERDGRYAKGTLKSYKNTKVYIYESTKDYRDDRSTLGSGYTDSNGDFRINVGSNYTNSEIKNFAYYADEDTKSKDDLKEVYPKNVELYGKSSGEYRDVKGTLKDYKNEKIYVYLKGNEKGNGKVDRDGDFDFRLSKYIDDKYDEDDLKFYVDDDTKSSSDSIFITRAIGGETKVEGKDAGKDATVEVKDSRSTKLGSTTADKDGKFTVSLNRALVGGETITITAKESGKSETKIDYIVPGFGGNINTPSININGYIKGYSDGSFQPNGNMTRAEAAVMMARLKNGSDNFNTSGITRFTDANNKWYSKGVNYAVGQGLINGYEDGTFRPDEKITRAEFTQMIANDIKTNGTKSVSFNDVNNHWAKPAIQKVAGNGIINGYEDNSFKPDNNITRAEAVKMLNGISNRPEGSKTNTFNDVRPSDWFYNDVMKAAN